MSKFYITTTLPYVNSTPHIWHALEFIQADIIARYYRKKLWKENVYFNLWTDEHWVKIYEKAIEEWLTTKEFVDKYSFQFKEFCEKFSISYDFFYRTSDDYHKKHVYKIWDHCLKNWDIYKKEYKWKYCIWCEEFKTEKDLIDWKCQIHKSEAIEISEENYFFSLSKYSWKLLDYIAKNPWFLKPASKLSELKNFVKEMQDISISRKKEKMPWWIQVPWDADQVIYVWFDALTNYIWSIWYADAEKSEEFNSFRPWVQIFWPDNLRFQWWIWQWMLAAANIPFSKKLLMHWYILDWDWQKMSKSLWNVVSPFDQLEKYWSEYIRFYLWAYLNTFWDWLYQEEELKNVINSNLADSFWNLLSRVVNLSSKKWVKVNDINSVSVDFKEDVDLMVSQAKDLLDDFELSSAYSVVNKIAIYWNKYMNDNSPWEKDKELNEIEICLNNLTYLLSNLIDLYEPVIPNSCEIAKNSLLNLEKVVLFKKID